MIIKTASALLFLCLCCTGMHAQEPRQSISAHWGITTPAGSGFIGKVGFVTPSLEWNYKIIPALSAGVSLGYGYATEKGEGNEYVDEDLVSGYREKVLKTMPVMAKLTYFPFANRQALFSPYIGVGAGIQYADFQITGEAINSTGLSNWAEVLSVEIGTRIQPRANDKIYFDARFLWQDGGNDWPVVKVHSIQRLGIVLGVGMKF